MVIGNGLIANTFKNYNDNDSIIIFASGVSNSKETNDVEFNREFEMLKNKLIFKKSKKIIYFSTCSVLDKNLNESKYVKHKKNIEEFIKLNFDTYLILRLPNIISNSNNQNTAFNYFKNKIIKQEEIICEKYATRYFIDIDDLKKTLPFFIDSKKYQNKVLNICFNNKETVSNFILKMGKMLMITPKITLIDNGNDYNVNNSIFVKELINQKYEIKDDYNNNIIKKYIIK